MNDNEIAQHVDTTPNKEKASITQIRGAAKMSLEYVIEHTARIAKRLKDKTPLSLDQACAMLNAAMKAMRAMERA